MLEIWESCKNEIEEIFKENSELRIDLTNFASEYYGIRMADSYDDCFEYITSIGCKVEGNNETLHFFSTNLRKSIDAILLNGILKIVMTPRLSLEYMTQFITILKSETTLMSRGRCY